MVNLKKPFSVALILLTLALAFSACSDGSYPDEGGGVATITINLGGSGAGRAIGFGSDITDETWLEYSVTLSNLDLGQLIPAIVTQGPTETTASATIAYGNWQIFVTAKLSTLAPTPLQSISYNASPGVYVYAAASQLETINASTGTINVQMKRPVGVTYDERNGNKHYAVVPGDGFVNLPSTPARSGFNFGGWFKESTLDTRWDFTNDRVTNPTSGAAQMTLYAGWYKTPDMVTINVAGTPFLMGSPVTEPGSATDETQHSVTLSSVFNIGKYEVTQEVDFTPTGIHS